jgi:hypothetical protein
MKHSGFNVLLGHKMDSSSASLYADARSYDFIERISNGTRQ